MTTEEQHIQNIENDFTDFDHSFQNFVNYYKKQSKRLDKIIKQSDKQQLQILKLNDELDQYKNKLEEKVEQKTKELKELNANLEQRVKDEVEANIQKDRQLNEQAKYVQLGELISNIAHHWRQPLSSISTIASNMQVHRELDMQDNQREDKDIQAILDVTQDLSTNIEYFRKFAQLTTEASTIDLKEHIISTIGIVDSSLQHDNIHTSYQFPDKEISIVTIPSSLSQSLLKLVKNAQEALNKQTNNVDKSITISINLINNKIDISVEDNANGIPKDILPKIFDPYFTTKHQSQGTGLGLYVARQSIENHLHGTINVNTGDNGTTFTITIPQKF